MLVLLHRILACQIFWIISPPEHVFGHKKIASNCWTDQFCPLQLCQVSSVLMLPPFSALFVRRQNIILVYEAIVKNLCMDL